MECTHGQLLLNVWGSTSGYYFCPDCGKTFRVEEIATVVENLEEEDDED